MTPVSAIAWLLMSTRFGRASTEYGQGQRWFWISGLAVVFFFASPLLGRPAINQVCRVLTRSSAQPLIAAIREYRNDQGALPEDPSQLVPDYLPSIPEPPCSFLTGYIKNDRYLILTDALTTNSADGLSCEDYSFDDNRWSVGEFDFIDYGPYCY